MEENKIINKLDNEDEENSDTCKRIKLEDNVENEQNELIKKRIRLKKFAVLISYCGAKYYGLQRNPNAHLFPTIEEEILKALHKAGVITQEQFDQPQIIYFQRAARTDKGVSAVRQILSLRLPDSFDDDIKKVNEILPPEIRVIGAKRTTKYFDCKNFCDGRTYSYMMPTYALCLPEEIATESFRINIDRIAEFNDILNIYKGTHNFHNFTSQKLPTDPSSQRYIISILCGEPFVMDGIEFVIVKVRGQSFMLHQIRKMIGLAIGIMRGLANMDTLKKTFLNERIDVPKAPGLGLMLEEVHYERYNRRFGGDGIREKLDWSEYNNVLNDFKEKHIYPTIINTEKNEHPMISWLQTLPIHTFDYREPGAPSETNDYKRAALNARVFDEKKEKEEDAKEAELNDEDNVKIVNELNSDIEDNLANDIELEQQK